MKSWTIGAALIGALAASAPTFASTGSIAQLEAHHPAMSKSLQYSDRGHWVMTLQADLNDLGFNSGPVDGVFGPITQHAVQQFQGANNLPVTGVTDPATWQNILAGFGLVPPATGSSVGSTSSGSSASGSTASSSVSTSGSHQATSGNTIDGRPILHVYHMLATAYGPSLADNYPYGPTDAFGQPLAAGMIAVDPSVIPLKSTVYVTGYQDAYLPQGGFLGHAMDTGGAIQGMRIDIFMNQNSNVVSNFGVQPVTVYVLGN